MKIFIPVGHFLWNTRSEYDKGVYQGPVCCINNSKRFNNYRLFIVKPNVEVVIDTPESALERGWTFGEWSEMFQDEYKAFVEVDGQWSKCNKFAGRITDWTDDCFELWDGYGEG